jgi:hypothetical protein
MEKHIISEGQTAIDVSIQYFGDIETGLFQILTANNYSINETLNSGVELTINNEQPGDAKSVQFFKNRNFTIINAEQPETIISGGDFNNDFSNDFNN